MERNDKVNLKFNIMAVILIIILSIAITPKTLQNDTFYTIEIGEHIVENGIDGKDPFSWHEGLKYTYPHWLYDVMIFSFYNIGGQLGVYISTMIFTAILGLVVYMANCKITKNRITSFIITIGVLYLMQKYIAARAQLVTFTLFVLTVYFIEMFLKSKKKRYVIGLVIIPILIANLHIAVFWFYFILYMPYIGEYIMALLVHSGVDIRDFKIKRINKKLEKTSNVKQIEKLNIKKQKLEEKKVKSNKIYEKRNKNQYKIIITRNENVKWLIIIMLMCLLTGLISPLGLAPYTYLINTMQGNTTASISEHLPLTLINDMNFMCVLVLFIAVLMFTDTKVGLSDLFMIGGLLFLSLYTRRQTSMFFIICGIILNRLVCKFFNKYEPDGCDKIEKRAVTLYGKIITVGLVLIISLMMYKPKINAEYIDEDSYPVQASDYILENLDIQNIKLYNEYNYGSYLLFKDIPVFIDSRADLYTPEFNEGIDVFSDSMNLSGLALSKIEDKFNQYGITHLIMYSKAKLRIYIEAKDEIYTELYDDEKFCIYERKI